MEKKEYQRVMQVLGEAVERAPAEREAWLNSACAGDESLYKEVLKLISHEKTAPDFMEESPFENAAWRQSEEKSLVGCQIGAYKIIEEIGRGGMGAVYLAQRADEEFESLVSIKIIKRGMDTDYILHSFRKERQILAYLNHPNIAKLLDGGTSEDGRPYFVMEYIKGQSIKRYCDEKKLTIEERLKLFLKVCSAVQYAHQNLIVHRDLKPSNILVTEDGTPKLLDFGIAKLLSSDHSNQEQTATNVRAMTPEYASPEQIKGEPVTTASDIYSLGVILYELLTGRRPYSFEGRSQAEVAQLISEQEPDKPSNAIAHTQQKTGADDAEKRQTLPEQTSLARRSTPAELSRRLRGDLDNIVLMAMRKESARRYASVEQFSEDIKRHLSGLPVRARKDTFRYRVSKFIQRNKVGVAAAAIVLLTLIGGISATLWQTHIARVEGAKAERRFNDIRKLADSFMFELNDEIEEKPTKAREFLVQEALEYLDGLAKEGGDDLSLQRDLATAYQRLGDIQSRLNSQNLGDTSGALESYRKSLAIRERIVASDPKDEQSQLDLALSYNRMGDVLSKINDASGSLENYQRAERLVEKTAAKNPANMQARRDLGYSYLMVGRGELKTGDLSGALDNFSKSQTIRETLSADYPADANLRQDLISSYDGIAFVLSQSGRPAEALTFYRKSLAVVEPLAAADPLNAKTRRRLIDTLEWVGITYGELDENDTALSYHTQALALAQALMNSDPANVQAYNDIADIYYEIGNAMVRAGRADEALKNFSDSIKNYEAVAQADPTDKNVRRQIYATYRQMGNAFMLRGDAKEALERYRKALTVFRELAAADPLNVETQCDIAESYLKIGEALKRIGDANGALENLRAALPIFQSISERSPINAKIRRDLALTYLELGDTTAKIAVIAKPSSAKRAEQWREAEDAYQKSLDIYQDMKSRGTLGGTDAGKPDTIASEIAKCDAALKMLGAD